MDPQIVGSPYKKEPKKVPLISENTHLGVGEGGGGEAAYDVAKHSGLTKIPASKRVVLVPAACLLCRRPSI